MTQPLSWGEVLGVCLSSTLPKYLNYKPERRTYVHRWSNGEMDPRIIAEERNRLRDLVKVARVNRQCANWFEYWLYSEEDEQDADSDSEPTPEDFYDPEDYYDSEFEAFGLY